MLSCHWSIVSLHWEKSQCISIYQRRLLQRRRVRSSSEQLKTITCILVFLKSNTELYMLPTRHVAQLNRFEIIFIHHPYLHHQLYLFLSLLSLSIALSFSIPTDLRSLSPPTAHHICQFLVTLTLVFVGHQRWPLSLRRSNLMPAPPLWKNLQTLTV